MAQQNTQQRRGAQSAGSNRGADKVDLYVGSRMRLRRAELGISQHELAERVGIAFQQIQKYEVGRNRVSASRLYAIGRALNTEVAYFFHGLDAAGDGRAIATSGRSSLPRIVNDPTMLRLLSIISRRRDQGFKDRAAAIVNVVAASDGRNTERAPAFH